jgi:hypothetical protein
MDLVSLEATSKIQLKMLAEEMQAVSKGLEKVQLEYNASESDGPVSEIFREVKDLPHFDLFLTYLNIKLVPFSGLHYLLCGLKLVISSPEILQKRYPGLLTVFSCACFMIVIWMCFSDSITSILLGHAQMRI